MNPLLLLSSLLTTLILVWVAPASATEPFQTGASEPTVSKPTVSEPTVSSHSGQQLEQQGRLRYQAGDFAAAGISFQSAAEAYQAQGNSLRQAINLSNLALCQQQLGQWRAGLQSIGISVELLQQEHETSRDRKFALAQALDIQASLHTAQGALTLALEAWQQSVAIYQHLGKVERTADVQVKQSQALQSLGRYRPAIAMLAKVLNLMPATLEPTLEQTTILRSNLATLPPSPTTIAALQSLGEALRVTGSLESAHLVLQHSITLAQQLQQPEEIATGSLRLGNLIRTQGITTLTLNNLTLEQVTDLIHQSQQGQQFPKTNLALEFHQKMQQVLVLYQQTATISTKADTRIQARLNQLSLLIDLQQTTKLSPLITRLQQDISLLPVNYASTVARINLAQQLIKLSRHPKFHTTTSSLTSSAAQLLAIANQKAKELPNTRTESFALGTLGKLYEQSGQTAEALDLTRQALLLAESSQASDMVYLWQWQMGRLLKAQGKLQPAILQYQGAVKTLEVVRKELVASVLTEQFAFRDGIEPIHRELVSLLLETQASTPNTKNLAAILDALESLQLSELVNFFREDCFVDLTKQRVDRTKQSAQTDATAAVLYSIVLGI